MDINVSYVPDMDWPVIAVSILNAILISRKVYTELSTYSIPDQTICLYRKQIVVKSSVKFKKKDYFKFINSLP